MYKSLKIKQFIFIICSTALFFSCPQSKQSIVRSTSVSEQDIESGTASLTYKEALVIFASGDVCVKGEADWENVEIGSIVYSGETINVGADSLCELQFAEKAVVRIQENTEIIIKDFWLEPDQTYVDINLVAGSVLCKVSRLSGAESFKVRTRVMVCGIRGTEFMVRITDSNDTCVAVKEGEVTIIPASAELVKISEQLQLESSEIKRLIKGIEDSALVVSASEEATVSEEDAKETEHLIQAMAFELKKVDKKEKLMKDELDMVTALVAETKAKINKAIEPAKEISAQKEEELKVLDKVEIKKIKIVPDKTQANTEKIIETSDKEDKEKEKATDKMKPGEGYIEVSAKESGDLYLYGVKRETISTQQKKTITVNTGRHSVEMHYENGKEERYDVIVKRGSTENVYFTYELMSDLVFFKDIRIDSKAMNGVRFVAEFEGYYRFMYKEGSYDAWPTVAYSKKNCVYIYKSQKVIWGEGLEGKLWPSQSDYQIGKIHESYEFLESAEKDAIGDYFDVYLKKNDYLTIIIDEQKKGFEDNYGSITLSVYIDKKDD